MADVTPSIFRLAETRINWAEFDRWLAHMGAPDWHTNTRSDAQILAEAAGKRCYKSFAVDLNPNLTRVRESDNHAHLGNLIRQKHGSVFEHPSVTFAVEDASRIFTHEVVRHRLCSYSQESMRFVRPTSMNLYFPDAFADIEDRPLTNQEVHALEILGMTSRTWFDKPPMLRDVLRDLWDTSISSLEGLQEVLVLLLGLDSATLPFSEKKKRQSACRRLVPDGIATGIVISANHRTWRYNIETRTSPHAEEEIRKVFALIAENLLAAFPNVYQDIRSEEIDGIPYYSFENPKI